VIRHLPVVKLVNILMTSENKLIKPALVSIDILIKAYKFVLRVIIPASIVRQTQKQLVKTVIQMITDH